MLKITVLSVFLIITWCFSFSSSSPYQTYTVNEGLSLNEIRDIYQDKHREYIWICTQNGLNRFNGHGIKKLYIERDSLKSNNLINDITEDNKCNLWIATNYGLAQFCYLSNEWQQLPYRLQTGKYRHVCFFNDSLLFGIRNDTLVEIRIESNDILLNPVRIKAKIITDIDVFNNELIIGTSSGIFKYNPTNNKVKKILQDYSYCNQIKYIKHDSSLWVKIKRKCYVIPVENGRLKTSKMLNYHAVLLNETGIDYQISDIEFTENKYWLATQYGLVSIHKKTHKIECEKRPMYWMNSLLRDNKGNLWCGTWQKGVVKFINKKSLFYSYRKTDRNNSIPSELISGILELDSNRMALATETEGMVVFNRRAKSFRERYSTLNTTENNDYFVQHNIMHCVEKDHEGRVWGGYYNKGFNIITGENKNNINRIITAYLAENSSLTCDDFYFDLKKTRVFIASSKGVLLFDIEKQKISTLLKSENVTAIYKDFEDNLWVATRTGLNIYNLQSGSYRLALEEKAKISGLFSIGINCFYSDSENNIWIGSNGDGIYKYNANEGSFTKIQLPVHIDFRVVYSIIEDNNGVLWLGTNSGLIGFDYSNDRFSRYSKVDGIQDNQFNYNSAEKAMDGSIFMGGINGFTFFNPQDLKGKKEVPQPVISDIILGEHKVVNFKGKQFPAHLSVPYTKNSFEIKFFTPDYTSSESYIYKYFLEGYSVKERLCPPNTSKVFFSNVPPGRYVLKISVTLPNSDWSEVTIGPEIRVLPPWYKSHIAYFGYLIVLVTLFFITFRITRKQALYKSSVELARLEKKQAEHLNQAKLRFFTDIAHEIRTPLTLILGPIQDIMLKRKLDKDLQKSLSPVHKSTRKLMSLMDELLLFRKAEYGALPLKLQENNIVRLIKNTCELFLYECATKNIRLQYESDQEINIVYDSEKMEKVLSNLISNAIKYTSNGGEVRVCVNKGDNGFEVSVKDSGKGISNNEIETIFNRFYQSTNNNEDGFGIGLALSKKIIEAHKGHLQVKSTLGKGSIFTVFVPHLKPNSQSTLLQVKPLVNDNTIDSTEHVSHKHSVKGNILIVEDNEEISTYIAGIFEQEYKVTIKVNGREGFEYATSNIPDIIISDYQMPEMDGITLCKKLKQEFTTSHIPVILLSAYNEVEEQLKGLESGANDYIGKPFHSDILLQKIGNILESRKQLIVSYKNGGNIDLSSFEIQDQRFLNKLNKVIANEMGDESFGVPVLCEKLSISRTTLNDKLRRMLDVSTAEYIKKTRLNEAYRLLTKENYSPSNAAYAVGFSPGYFTICFKKEYGVPPGKV
ncbi:ATP-binding protein [Bacteroidales bacterium]|nr:ATP-binding protein [Bacteroidales bacterium]